MTDFRAALSTLRRPRLLIRAARFGLQDYRRERDLRRLLAGTASPEVTVPRLLQEEAQLEEIRQAGDHNYSVMRHIEVLVALFAEVQLLPRKLAL